LGLKRSPNPNPNFNSNSNSKSNSNPNSYPYPTLTLTTNPNLTQPDHFCWAHQDELSTYRFSNVILVIIF
jgi:hypothetical protein